MLTPTGSPLRPVRVGSSFVKFGSLLLWFGDGGQQPVSLVLVLLQQLLGLFLRQLHVQQLLQQVALLLWKTAADWSQTQKLYLAYCHRGLLVPNKAEKLNIKL